MLTLKTLKTTKAYAQLKHVVQAYAARNGYTDNQRAYAQGQLVRRFLVRVNEQNHDGRVLFPDDFDVDRAMIWDRTAEGQNFWEEINDYVAPENLNPVPINPPKVVKKPAPKKRVGWWAL